MGLVQRLTCAKLPGAGLLLASGFCLLVAHLIFLVDVTGEVQGKIFSNTPGIGASLRNSTIVVVLFGALLSLLVLGLLVVTLLGMTGLVPRILWIAAAVLFIPLLAGALIAADASKYGASTTSVVQLEEWIPEHSEKTKAYVQAYETYAKSIGVAVAAGGALGVGAATAAQLLELNRTLGADQAIPKDVFWRICNSFTDDQLTALAKLDEGKSDAALGGSFTYWTHDKDRPLQLDADRLFAVDPSTGRVAIPSYTAFYSQKAVPACYGTKVDAESVAAAIRERDLCRVRFTAKACAPGWTVDYILEGICERVTKCQEEAQETLDVWKDVLKGEKTELPGFAPMAAAYRLKAGWKEEEELEKYYKKIWLEEAELSRKKSVDIYHQMSLTFACVGAVGWAFVVLGIVLGFVGGDDGGSENES